MSIPAPLPDAATGPVPEPGAAVELRPGLRRVTAPNPGLMTGPGTNTYLVGQRELVVVDPGPDDQRHLDALVVAIGSCSVKAVAVTHTHRDHAPGASPLAALVGAPVVGFSAREGFDPDRTVADGAVLETDAGSLVALHTPGHASDHVCWSHTDSGALLTGDHVMEGSTVVISPPDGSVGQYLASLRRVMEPPAGMAVPRVLAPGHGRLIADPGAVVAGIVGHRLAREARVADALVSAGRGTVDSLLAAVYADVTRAELPVARLSLWAHLRHLAEQGMAVAQPGGLEGMWVAS